MERFELHCHTNHSKCAAHTPEQVLKAAKARGLTGIAITDHNTIRGARAAEKLNQDKDFTVIVGEEVKTEIGEVLVYFVQTEIRPGRFQDVIKEARRQKALCVLAHPYNRLSDLTNRLLPISGRRSLRDESVLEHLDAIEITNGRCFADENRSAAALASRHHMPGVCGSDAHFPDEIGRLIVEFEGGFREAILSGRFNCIGRPRLPFLNRMRSMWPTLLFKLRKH